MNCLLARSSALGQLSLCYMEIPLSICIRERCFLPSKKMNEHITNKMPSGLITVNRDGKILSHNPASDRIFDGKLSKNSMFRDMVRESDVLQTLLDRCVRDAEVFTRVEFNASTAHGDKRIG